MIKAPVARYFVADIHLNDDAPAITNTFIQFLVTLPPECELYILGDLFDYWVGDDIQDRLHQKMASVFCQLNARNIHVFYLHGNRDFLLGKGFARQSAFTLLPEVYTLMQGKKKIVLIHGDTLCTDDRAYQIYRRIIHNPVLQFLFLSLPCFLRKKMAEKFRRISSKQNKSKDAYKMDVNLTAIAELVKKYNADIIIQGHTHKPAHIKFVVAGRPVERFVLGAWHDNCDYVRAKKTVKLIALCNTDR